MPSRFTIRTIIPTRTSPYAERLLWVCIWVIVGLATIHILLQFLHLVVYDGSNQHLMQLSNRFDFDDESSVPTWFSALLLALTAGTAFLAAYLQTNHKKRTLWILLGSISLLFSMDEIAGLHEYVLQLTHIMFFGYDPSTFLTNAWWIIIPIVLIGAGLLFWRIVKLLPHRTVTFLVIGTAIYFTGAMLIEVITTRIDGSGFTSQGLMVAAEECLELLGVSVVLYAIIDYLEIHYGKKLHASIRALQKQPIHKNAS